MKHLSSLPWTHGSIFSMQGKTFQVCVILLKYMSKGSMLQQPFPKKSDHTRCVQDSNPTSLQNTSYEKNGTMPSIPLHTRQYN